MQGMPEKSEKYFPNQKDGITDIILKSKEIISELSI
jgi:hypothetical protein